jgi:hypothetical protein
MMSTVQQMGGSIRAVPPNKYMHTDARKLAQVMRIVILSSNLKSTACFLFLYFISSLFSLVSDAVLCIRAWPIPRRVFAGAAAAADSRSQHILDLLPIRPLNEGNGILGGAGLRGEGPYPSLPKEAEKGSTETFVPVPLGVGCKTLPVRGPVPICLPSVMVAAAGRWAIRA